MLRCSSQESHASEGLTLIEVVIVVAIVGLLAAIAVPSYVGYKERARTKLAIAGIRNLEFGLSRYVTEWGTPPDSLGDVVDSVPVDPWGNPYEYLNLQSGAPGINGQRRRDKNLNPVNSDYDLYSMGPDGQTTAQFSAKKARDDIVRAADGEFVGIAEEY